MRRKHPEPLKQTLERVVRLYGLEDALARYAVGPVWDDAVPARLAEHTRPASLQGGVLLIEARSAVWMNEASLMREQLRRAINRALGKERVRELRFRLGGGFPRQRSAEPPPPSVETVEETAQELGAHDGAKIVARARALQKANSR